MNAGVAPTNPASIAPGAARGYDRCMAPHFSPELFRFLTELKRHNDKAWFEEHQERFENVVRSPALRFIEEFAGPLNMLSHYFVAEPRKAGGSLFRIHRDARFSKDKSPYKTNVGIQFRHQAGKDVHAPGFYLHLEPENCFMGVGIWHPDAPTTNRIRKAIAEEPAAWKKAAYNKPFVAVFELGGDSLKRTPRPYDDSHPAALDLRRKDFIAGASLTEALVCSPTFLSHYAESMAKAAPLMAYLCRALGLPY